MSMFTAPENNDLDAIGLATAVQDYQTPLGEYLGAKVREGFWNSFLGQGVEQYGAFGDFRNWAEGPTDMQDFHARMRASMNGQPLPRHDYGRVMGEEEWKASEWHREGLQWDDRMTEQRAQALADTNDEMRYRRWLIDRSPNGLRNVLGFGGMMVGGAPDPVNYIPFLGPAAKTAAVARFGVVGGHALVHSADAMIGAAITAPVVMQSQREFGDDVTFADAVMDVAMAGLFGAAFGGGIGGWTKYRGRRVLHDLQTVREAHEVLDQAVGDVANGRSVQISPSTLAAVVERKAEDMGMRPAPVEPPAGPVLPDGVRVIAPGDKDGLVAWVKEALATPGNKLKAWLGEVSEGNARVVADATGVDITGYRRVWEQSYIRHVDKEHGPEAVNSKNGHMDLTPEQMAMVQEVVDSPDRVARTVTDRGRDAILYEKRVGDYFIYVEEVRAGKRTLAIDTMYRRPKPDDAAFAKAEKRVREKVSGGPDASSSKGSPQGLRPETTPALDSNIASEGAAGKATRSAELEPAYVDRPANLTPPAEEPTAPDVTAAASRVGKPADDLAKELGVDPKTGDFDERATFEQLSAEGRLLPEEVEAIRAAEATMEKAESYGRAYEAAAACLMRKA